MSEFFHQQPIILASGSPNRRVQLETAGLHFEVHPSQCDEEALKQSFQGPVDKLAQFLAHEKAREVSERHPEIWIIAADQLCILGSTVLNKPLTHTNAVRQLEQLAGKTHRLSNAVCLAKGGKIVWTHSETVTLTMRSLSTATIENYLLKDTPYHSCGAFHYESRGRWLFSEVSGHESSIIGLPLEALFNALIKHGIVALDQDNDMDLSSL